MTQRSAVDCLRRAGLSLRANWALLPLTLLQELCTLLLFLLSLLPPFLVLGGRSLLDVEWTVEGVQLWLQKLFAAASSQPLALTLSLVASMVVGTLAMIVWAWFEGGIYGVLLAAERQALPDAQNRSGGVAWFSAMTGRDFAGWGGLYMWRYFWWLQIGLAFALGLLLLYVLIVLGAAFGYEAWGGAAAYGIGCGAALPFFFCLLVLVLWSQTSPPAVALPESGAVRATGAGFRLIGRRPGAVLLIFVCWVVLFVVVFTLFWVLDLVLGLGDSTFLTVTAVSLFLGLVEWLVNACIGLYGRAAYTSLVAAEAPEIVR
jgi:hypothetical protein